MTPVKDLKVGDRVEVLSSEESEIIGKTAIVVVANEEEVLLEFEKFTAGFLHAGDGLGRKPNACWFVDETTSVRRIEDELDALKEVVPVFARVTDAAARTRMVQYIIDRFTISAYQ